MGNVVRYDDLMPIGEDLVEIILDPTASAMQVDDLYHIVIKASGQAIFERGVEVEPPIGNCRPWVAKQHYTIQEGQGHWSAEVAIPLDAFDARGWSPGIWGVNIARLEPVRGEYSNWAGARRHCYNPRSLGNLVWPG
jgi:hypothetical protein